MNPNKDRTEVVFLGTPTVSSSALEVLIKSFSYPLDNLNFIIKTVITAPDNLIGRKQLLTPTPVAKTASRNAIKTLKPVKLDSEFISKNLKDLEADLYILVAYGKILPASLLGIPQFGTINIHPSLLPKYRGPSPIQSAILQGDSKSGVSVMLLDEKMDHGPIISQKELVLHPTDTADSLSSNFFSEGIKELVKILPKYIKGQVFPIEQDHSKATFTKLIKKTDGFFEVSTPPSPKKLDRMIRAFYPWPTVWTKWNDKVVKLLPNKTVQMEGKKPIFLKNFLHGYPNFPIKEF